MSEEKEKERKQYTVEYTSVCTCPLLQVHCWCCL